MIKEKGRRKIRSDKKIDCKPTISVELKECIYRLSYITNTPVKDVAEKACVSALTSKRVIEFLSNYFKRDFGLGSTLYIGDLNRRSLQKVRFKGNTDRITIRFKQEDYLQIKALAYALDVTPSKATAILLEISIKKTNFINRYIKEYLKGQLDHSRLREIRKIISYLNQNNPSEEKISWASLFSYLYDELLTGASNVTKALNEWIDQKK